MTDTIEIDVILCETPGELHCHYQGQYERQDAFIELDLERGHLYASYNAILGGGMPGAVYHGQTRRYAIPVLAGDAANRVLSDIKPFAERILGGWENKWDGSNWTAVLGSDALKAEAEIEKKTAADVFDLADLVEEIDASDWMQYSDDGATTAEHGITAETTDTRLSEIAEKITHDAATPGGYGYLVINGMEEYLQNLRDQLRTASGYHDADA